MPEAAELPNDVEALRRIVLEHSAKLEAAEALLIFKNLELEKLRFEIAYLKRMKYGRSSEQLDRELVQMQLSIEDLESSLAAKPLEVRPAAKEPSEKPARRPLPAELPREEIVHENPCACPDCGGKLRPLGEVLSEMLGSGHTPSKQEVQSPRAPRCGRVGTRQPRARLFRPSPDRKGERPRAHLANFTGVLQADAYAGFDQLYGEKIKEAACWAHVRRKFYDIHVALCSPIALEALERIGRLYKVEEEIRGRPPHQRHAVRQGRAGPELKSLFEWLHKTATTLSKKSELAKAIRYALSNWVALTRYCEDGRLEIDNNAAERALRAVALGRKNWLFAGSDDGGERAAAIYTLLGTAKLNDLNPESYLRYVLERIADHPINKIEELLPWNLVLKMPELRIAA